MDMSALLEQLYNCAIVGYIVFQIVVSLFWKYKRCPWPWAAGWKLHTGGLMDVEAAEHEQYMPAWRGDVSVLALHLFSDKEY